MRPTRRAVLATAAAAGLAACDGRAEPGAAAVPLKLLAPFPVGTCVMSGQIGDTGWRAPADAHFDQVSPEWEMKMEYILQPDGSYRFDAPDRIAAYARASGKRLYCTTLVWYAQKAPAFAPLEGNRPAFERAYRNYILEVAGRYRGQAVAWDVVNEPIMADGSGYRESLWSRALGPEHIDLAFAHAAEADPRAARVLNEYDLEVPAKRAAFLRLAEGLLKRGAPVSVLGTQSHLNVDLAPGAYRAAMRELASLGLPIHISELDISYGRGAAAALRPPGDNARRQARVAGEVIEAFLELPERQRFGFTLWGVRDQDSWLRRPPNDGGLPVDGPLLLDDRGRPKAAFESIARALA